ncbi:(2Fe-2S)-binding protein [Labrys monachus]|uniref:(2Fe-2S)-binding protein n=1 Tax=Labrys monachus TaxID=217067 RepID=A0ABU0FG99_9HYPH|nr:(2Fe-2S)-binding protein [Labrys monachus]MDQ0393642.1 hypothetical protein [Labrys monachus]
MFKRIDGAAARPGGTLFFEGRAVAFEAGDSVAAALLAASIDGFRDHAVTRSARGPYCMMGICFECLAEVDGVQNRQTCLLKAEDGMAVRRQRGARVLP